MLKPDKYLEIVNCFDYSILPKVDCYSHLLLPLSPKYGEGLGGWRSQPEVRLRRVRFLTRY